MLELKAKGIRVGFRAYSLSSPDLRKVSFHGKTQAISLTKKWKLYAD